MAQAPKRLRSIIDQRECARNFGSWNEFFPCWIITKHGETKRALFTYDQIAAAILRAEKHPKEFDVTKKTGWKRFVDRVFGNKTDEEPTNGDT